ncbi:MAG: calcium-translocating P-type ATPase, PMCA-type [Candidatus Eremiobacterota bacterium]
MDEIKSLKENWHSETVEQVLSHFKTDINGLSEKEGRERIHEFGANELAEKKKESIFMLLLEQFSDFLIIVLAVASVISGIKGDWVEAITIIVIVILAGLMGFIQEYQAGKAIEKLKKMAAPNATVIRGGEETVIPSREIVPGDICLIKTGDMIPADARLIEATNLKINEAPLTGESTAVEKSIEPVENKETSLGDRKNMVYTGTSATYGRGKAVVVATGMNTEFGRIAGLLQSTQSRKTPLQNNLDQLGKQLGIFSLILAAVIAAFGVIMGKEIQKMFIWGVALAVAVIPEALPAVVTISLALGVRRLVKRRALIRSLPSVETLGATTVICSDKTGTLTQDAMTVRKIYCGGQVITVTGTGYNPTGDFSIEEKKITPDDDLKKLLEIGVLCNDTHLKQEEGEWKIIGDPTEGALVVIACKGGINSDEIRKEIPRTGEIPFSSETKKMTTSHRFPDGEYACTKGAPEIIIDNCNFMYQKGQILPLKEQDRKEILMAGRKFGEDALRVLALSFKKISSEDTLEHAQKDMVFAGLAGMIDPPRPEVKDAIKVCEHAGIKPVMITGDHKITAVAVAKELGLMKSDRALTGVELDKLSDEEFDNTVEDTQVYARISPSHKLRIVNAFMNKGHVVAMTGDGVNDAPALKKADIGVAMGITGTDVSKEASDMILTDDNFASIVSAVEEGRSIFENIRKYLVFLLSGNMGTVFAMIISILLFRDFPLVAVQILFINFIMDGLMAIALGVEPPEHGIMERCPRNLKEGILNKKSLLYIGAVGLWMSLATIGVYRYAIVSPVVDDDLAKTMFFVTLIVARLFNGFNCRSLNESIFRTGLTGNKWLIVSAGIAMGLTCIVLYYHLFHEPFETKPLDTYQWAIVVSFAFTVMVFGEIIKFISRKIFS